MKYPNLQWNLSRHDTVPGDIAPMAPEDEVVGVDIGDDMQQDAGQAIEGQLVYAPDRGDHLNVNGTELFPHTALATLREACGFYKLVNSLEGKIDVSNVYGSIKRNLNFKLH